MGLENDCGIPKPAVQDKISATLACFSRYVKLAGWSSRSFSLSRPRSFFKATMATPSRVPFTDLKKRRGELIFVHTSTYSKRLQDFKSSQVTLSRSNQVPLSLSLSLSSQGFLLYFDSF